MAKQVTPLERNVLFYQSQLETAAALYQRALQEKRGRIVIIAGQRMSGRTEALSAIAYQLHQEKWRPHIIAGTFTSGKYTAKQLNLEPFFASFGETAQVMKAPLEILSPRLATASEFLGQLTLASIANKKLLEGNDETNWRYRLESLIKQLSKDAPLALFIDDVDNAVGEQQWFWELLNDLTPIIDRYPILFFVTVKGNVHPPKPDEGFMWGITNKLIRRDVADWQYLKPLTVDVVRAYIGDAAPGIASTLHAIANGYRQCVIEFWQEWKANDRVRYSSERGQWEYVHANKPTMQFVAQARKARLERIFPRDYDARSEAEQILGYAALMGDEFVCEVVAEAMEFDPDYLARFFNNALVFSENNPDGMLVPVQEAETEWTVRNQDDELCPLRRYRFKDGNWQFLSHLEKSPAEKSPFESPLMQREVQKAALAMIKAIKFYFGHEIEQLGSVTPGIMPSHEVGQILITLARLCRLLSDAEAEQHFQTMVQYRVSRAVLIAQAERLLTQDTAKYEKWEWQHAANILLSAGEEMSGETHEK